MRMRLITLFGELRRAPEVARAADGGEPGVLLRLLEARGAIVGPGTVVGSDVGAWDIVCPNHGAHARQSDYALLMAGPIGLIVCHRRACQTITEWLPYFDNLELQAAGITPAQVCSVYRGRRDDAGRDMIGLRLEGGGGGHYYQCLERGAAYEALLAAGHADDPEQLKGAWLGLGFGEEGRITNVHCIQMQREWSNGLNLAKS